MKINKFGFTLVEILVALTILSLVGVVAIPNLKKFSNDQLIETDYQDLRNVLRQAQSSAISGIKCSTKPSTKWVINLNPTDLTTQSKSGYKLIPYCQDPADASPIQEPRASKEFSTGTTVILTGCATTVNNIDLIFQTNRFSVDCKNGDTPTYPFEIKIRNSNDTSYTKSIKINQIGVLE